MKHFKLQILDNDFVIVINKHLFLFQSNSKQHCCNLSCSISTQTLLHYFSIHILFMKICSLYFNESLFYVIFKTEGSLSVCVKHLILCQMVVMRPCWLCWDAKMSQNKVSYCIVFNRLSKR